MVAAPVGLDSERQALAQSYSRDRLRTRAWSLGLSLAWLVVLGPLHGASALRSVAEHASSIWPIQVAVFFGLLGLGVGVTSLPGTYISGFVLPHRYGQSTQTLRAWIVDGVKGAALAGVLGVIAVEMLYGFLRLSPDLWWLWTGVGFTVLSLGLTVIAPVLILPLFYDVRALSDAELAMRIVELAARAQTRIERVGEIELSSKTVAANAAVIGMGRTRKIVLGDTLLSQFPRDEVEVVVAHELGHHVHGDLAKGTIVGAALSLAGFLVAQLALQAAITRMHFAGPWDLAAFPVLAAALGAWGALSGLAELALSRRLESSADAFSLQLTGAPDAYVRSEVRLTNQNLAWFDPPVWLEVLFYTHPAPWRRVAMGERFARDSAAT